MITRIFNKLIKLALITLCGFLIYVGILNLYPTLIKLNLQHLGSIITGVITLSVGLGAVLIAQSKIKKERIR